MSVCFTCFHYRSFRRQVRQARLSGWYILVICPNQQHLDRMTSRLHDIMLTDMAFLLIDKEFDDEPDTQIQVKRAII